MPLLQLLGRWLVALLLNFNRNEASGGCASDDVRDPVVAVVKRACFAVFHQGSSGDQGRCNAAAWKMAPMAGHSSDGHLPSFLSAAAVQSECEEGSLGGPKKGPALRVRLGRLCSQDQRRRAWRF